MAGIPQMTALIAGRWSNCALRSVALKVELKSVRSTVFVPSCLLILLAMGSILYGMLVPENCKKRQVCLN